MSKRERTSGVLDLVAVPVLIIVVGTWGLIKLRHAVYARPVACVEVTSEGGKDGK